MQGRKKSPRSKNLMQGRKKSPRSKNLMQGRKKSPRSKKIDDVLPLDDPLLRSEKANVDKTIGSEGQRLASKRLDAIKRARKMSSKADRAGTSSGSFSNTSASSQPFDNSWVQLGPNLIPNGQTYSEKGTRVNVLGRITAIVPHPLDSNTIFIGAAQGGVWKTIDGGKNWMPTSDDALSLAIGALTIDQSNPDILYAGTGEGNFNGDSQYGLGIIKSIDGGKTWNSFGTDVFISSRFCRLAVNPINSSIIFAATTSVGDPDIASGLYRSTNGGESWKRMEGGLPPISTIGATDILYDPSNPDVAYAAFFGIGIFKTSNANSSDPIWNRLTSGFPTSNITRISLGISHSSPQVLYALMSNGSRPRSSFDSPFRDRDPERFIIDQFYRTEDGGQTWKRIQLPGKGTKQSRWEKDSIGGQGFYNINVAVNPSNENLVYLSGISLWKAIYDPNTNNCRFLDIGKEIHPDNHTFAFNPENPKIIYAGNDGGIYQSNNEGEVWVDTINQGFCITQFEFMDQHPTSDKIILLGTQDNGTIRYEGTTTFSHIDDGDGGFVCVDMKEPKNVWHTFFGLSPCYSSQGGDFGSWQDLSGSINLDHSNFYPPLSLDKTNADNIAIGGKILYLDHSKGKDNWPERIDIQIPENDLISAINYVSTNLIYLGTIEGRIYCLTKHNGEWKVGAIHSPDFPRRYIWDIATLPNDESKLIAVVSGFGTPHVFSCAVPLSGVGTWTDISGEGDGRLPDIPVNAVAINDTNPDTIYIGTDVGVFSTVNRGKNWKWISEDVPNCQVYDLRFHSQSGFLRAATHGRGLWQRKVE